MSSLLDGVRLPLRSLARARTFSFVVIATLAVSIGATTIVFSVVEGVLLQPLPYPQAEELVGVAAGTSPQAPGDGRMPFSDRGYWHFAENNRAFSGFGAYRIGNAQVPLTSGGPPLQVHIVPVTRSALELIGLLPVVGRLPSPEEDLPGGSPVALISHGLWVDRYGSDPDIVGSTIELNGRSREVVGVMPPDYDFPRRETDVWIPLQLDPGSENYATHYLWGIARLGPGVSIDAAVADSERLIAGYSDLGYEPRWFEGILNGQAVVHTLKGQLVGDTTRPLLILLGTMGFVLLIACSTVANLFLVRADVRKKERAVRVALGAGSGRMLEHDLAESILLAVSGGLLGVLVAALGTPALISFAPAGLPRFHEVGINSTVLLFATGITVLVGIVLGALPSLRGRSGTSSLAVLRQGGVGTTAGKGRHRVRATIVVSQVAVALVLLVGAGLMVRSFQELRSVNPGFDAQGVMTFRLSPPLDRYPDGQRVAQFYDELVERLLAIPGVTAAAGIDNLPLSGGGEIRGALIDDHPLEEGEFPPLFLARRVTPGYFEAMGIPIVSGRELTADDHNARLESLIISESVKREFWPDESAIGKRITIQGAPGRVVGVVRDVHDTGLQVPAEQFSYKPMLDSIDGGVRGMMMVVRSDGDPNLLVPGIRGAVEDLDPLLPIIQLQPMEALVQASMSRTTFTMTLLLVGALIGLFLGSVGIYGVLSYIATLRTPEIGIRLALGADASEVWKIMMSRGMTLAGIGVVVGIVFLLVMGGLLESLLYNVTLLDPMTLGAVTVLILTVAAVASALPARRAARTAPGVSLRAP